MKRDRSIAGAGLALALFAGGSLGLVLPGSGAASVPAAHVAAPNELLRDVAGVTYPAPVVVPVAPPVSVPVTVPTPPPVPPVAAPKPVTSAPVVVVPTTVPAPPAPVVKPTFLAEAQSQIGAVDPSYYNGGNDWCYLFVNYVGDNSNTPGWVDAASPGTFANAVDPAGPQPGDIAQYDDSQQAAEGNDYVVHVGIVESVDTAAGTFVAIEGNGVSSTTVVETTRPISGTGPEGYQVLDFLLQ